MSLPGMEQDLSDFLVKLNTREENIAAELARALQENEALKAEMIRKDKWAEDLVQQLEILGGNSEEDKAKAKLSRSMGKGMEANLKADVTSDHPQEALREAVDVPGDAYHQGFVKCGGVGYWMVGRSWSEVLG
ncbi:hypothetical protein D1P53_001303 [Cryptococcus gattii VGV]|nr:hypothetical protein D1P53_001303 [Cryptococcus gattii VGV]